MAQRKVLVVIPLTRPGPLDLQRVGSVVRNMGNGIRTRGLTPVFHVAYSAGGKKALRKAIGSTIEEMSFFKVRKGIGFGEALINLIDGGVKKHSPDFVMPGYGDYLRESEETADMLKQVVRRNGPDFATGAWKRFFDTRLELPHPQYLNEIAASGAVTYANPRFKPRDFQPQLAIGQAVNEGKSFQTFGGFFILRAVKWNELKKELYSTLKGAKEFYHGWGAEPALLLSALNRGMRVENVFFHRGYEHDFPTEREKFVASRLNQFEHAMGVVKHFLAATLQTEKLGRFDDAVEQQRKKIEESPLVWKHYERAKEKIKPEFRYPRKE